MPLLVNLYAIPAQALRIPLQLIDWRRFGIRTTQGYVNRRSYRRWIECISKLSKKVSNRLISELSKDKVGHNV